MTLSTRLFFHISRSLVKHWGVSLLNIAGFAIGTAAALVIALYVRNELTYDRFIPDADRILLLSTVYSPPGSPVVSSEQSPAGLAGWLRADAPAVDAVARIHPVDWPIRSPRLQALEHFYWADANLFDLLRVKAVAGDLRTALRKPDTVVMTRRVALRYFGREDVVGQTVYVGGNFPVTITAVLADFPANSSLGGEIFVSASTGYSMLSVLALHPNWQWSSSYTFARLKPGARLTAQEILSIAVRHWKSEDNLPAKFRIVPLADLHFQPEADSQMAPRGHLDTVFAMTGLAAFVQFLAAVNLAGLMTAQIEERRGEMAVRHSLGAKRHHLFIQILLEAAVIVVLAVFAGLMLAERLLPLINHVLRLQLSLWSAPVFLAGCLLGAAFAGIAAGLHPAIALSSSDTPASRRDAGTPASYGMRASWIVVQFALLITLLVSSQIVYRQWAFAMGPALNFDAARVIQIWVYDKAGQDDQFRQHVQGVKGVEDAAYSRFIPDNRNIRPAWSSPNGRRVQFNRESVDTHFFRMFAVHLIAGRNFDHVYFANQPPEEVILSRSAAQALGYRQPADAVGKVLDYEADQVHVRSRIIGVVEDMRIGTVREAWQPLVFDNQSFFFTRLNVRLKPGSEAATMAAIDQLWKRDFPDAGPINRHAFSDDLDELYHDMAQQWWAFGLLSIVGVCLSVLGLTGLSIYLARSQMREMAIRNALGAKQWDIFRLRLAPFVKPLILANAAAGILSWLLMSWWLKSFKTHVDIDALSFINAGAATVLITLAALTVHSLLSTPARSSGPLHTN